MTCYIKCECGTPIIAIGEVYECSYCGREGRVGEPEYQFGWEDCAEALLVSFVCACGSIVVDQDNRDEYRHVAHNGCGRDELETVECDQCGRTWRARWKGMEFEQE